MSRMVDTVLDFARLQVGKLELRQLAFGLNSVVGETLRHFQPMADQNGVRLVLDIAGEVRVRADSARVAQVLSNLLSNSVRFTPKGGEVHVSTRRENAFGVVSVRDTGAGLNAGQVQKFNLSLAQLHQAGQGPDTGVGLGLYLSKGLVERMGGRLSAESPGPGRGATFQFTVPIAEASLAETDVPLAARALP
jgi:signal transduction histidine kinase